MQFRCPSRIQFEIEEDLYKVKCSSKHCGARSGVAVFHYYDMEGKLLRTRKFTDPAKLFTKSSTT